MQKLILFLALTFSTVSFSQEIIPFVDFNGYFKTFQDGFFRQIDFQPIRGMEAGDELVAYIDNRSNLVVYNGTKPQNLSNINSEYVVSDHLLTWKIGSTLNMWDAGEVKTLTYWANEYEVRDSIIVYQHTQTNSVMVYYNGESYSLYTMVGDLSMPDFIGENIVAFRDNGNYYKVFWRGNIYNLGVWHDRIDFSGGTDVLAFNDPTHGTFAIFENGEFLDVEDFYMTSYQAGRGFIVYENQNHDLMYYGNGIRKKLTNFGATYYRVKDDVVLWNENGITYGYYNGNRVELARYDVDEFVLKNGVIAFKNVVGGVDALVDGKLKTLTNQMDATFEIYGNSVLVKLFNSSFLVYQNGRTFTN